MSDELMRYRTEFPILYRTTYLISNSLGAMPRGVSEVMQAYADTWATRGVRAWEERWWMLAADVGDQIGALMNAPKGSVATHPNVTTCQAVVASCFDFAGARNKVVYSDLNFPSVMYFWEAQRERGARVHMVKTDGVAVPTERLLDAIDEQTLLVPISHVLFRSAYINDAAAIVDKAHKVGARVLLDTFQSLGTVPVDVQQLNVDFACGGVLKWLCGGPGTAYLYVRPDLGRTLRPTFTGWFAHENPFGFEIGPVRYTTASAYRFMNGTTPIPALEAARPGLAIVAEAGVERIREKSKRQTAHLIELAERRGWTVNTPRDPEQRGGTVSIDMPQSERVCRELLKRDILVDWRPKAGVRMSPHFYTADEELETAMAAAEDIVRS